jgi:hypothetical protein
MKDFAIRSTLDTGVVTRSAIAFVERRSVLRRKIASAKQKQATTRHTLAKESHK